MSYNNLGDALFARENVVLTTLFSGKHTQLQGSAVAALFLPILIRLPVSFRPLLLGSDVIAAQHSTLKRALADMMNSLKSDEEDYDSSNNSAISEPSSGDNKAILNKSSRNQTAGRLPNKPPVKSGKRALNANDGQQALPALSLANGSIQYQTPNGAFNSEK